MTFIHGQVFHKLTVEHRQLLFSTPFLHLFVIPKKLQVSNAILHTILTKYDNDHGYFVFQEKKLYFTSGSVSHFICLPSKGDVVDLSQVRNSTSLLREKYFGRKSQIRRQELEKVIVQLLDSEASTPRDVVSLLVLYLFTTILFPNTAGSVPLHLFRYAELIWKLISYIIFWINSNIVYLNLFQVRRASWTFAKIQLGCSSL